MKRMNDANQRKQQILQTALELCRTQFLANSSFGKEYAYYEATDRKASAEKIGNLCTEALIRNNRTMGKFMNFNWKWVQNIYASLYQMLKKQVDHSRLV